MARGAAAAARRQKHYLRQLRARAAKAGGRYFASMRALRAKRRACIDTGVARDDLVVSISISIAIR